MTYAAVIFDLDGTLVDTETQSLAAGRAALAQMGHDLTDDLFHQLIGTDREAGEEILRAALGPLDFAQLDKLWITESRKLQAQGVPQKAGAATLLTHLRTHLIPVAVATSSYHKGAHAKLALSGLAPFFETVVTRDCVTDAKPAPEPYLLAASRLGVAAEACLAFEDSDPGAASAFAAGMQVVQVADMGNPTGHHAHHRAKTLLQGARSAGLQIPDALLD